MVDAVIRGMAKRVLADACEAAVRLQRTRVLLHFLQHREAAGRVAHIGRQPGIFEEDWSEAVRQLGQPIFRQFL